MRYFAADSMSWPLQAMRRYESNVGDDVEPANAEFRGRFRRFKISTRAIAYSAFALGLGAVFLVAAIIIVQS